MNYNENEQSNKRAGKHYTVSNFSGLYGTYLDALDCITDDDTLYIFGNVMGRDAHGIRILQDIMKRPNIEFALGENEWLFLKSYDLMKKYDMDVDEMVIYTRLYAYIEKWKRYLISDATYKHGVEAVKEQFTRKGYTPKNIDEREIEIIANAIKKSNIFTFRAFVKMSKDEQEQLIKYLKAIIADPFTKDDEKAALKCYVMQDSEGVVLYCVEEDTIRCVQRAVNERAGDISKPMPAPKTEDDIDEDHPLMP